MKRMPFKILCPEMKPGQGLATREISVEVDDSEGIDILTPQAQQIIETIKMQMMLSRLTQCVRELYLIAPTPLNTISGVQLVERLLTFGTSQGGFTESTLEEIASRQFRLHTVDLAMLRSYDGDFDEYCAKGKPRQDFDADGGIKARESNAHNLEPQYLPDEPIVIIDNQVRDGYNRALCNLLAGGTMVKAWIA